MRRFRSADLIILRELIANAAQIQPQANLTDDQVACMGGGPTLRIEAIAPETRGSLSTTLQPSIRSKTNQLMKGLISSGLAKPLLVLIAQQREFCIETVDKTEEHLKHISNLYDEVRQAIFESIPRLTLVFAVSSRSLPIYRILDCCYWSRLYLIPTSIGRSMHQIGHPTRCRFPHVASRATYPDSCKLFSQG